MRRVGEGGLKKLQSRVGTDCGSPEEPHVVDRNAFSHQVLISSGLCNVSSYSSQSEDR